ncbi:MAG: CbiX/SirB N-terminal domain-containing protein [Planctomycetota bacterium]|nr:CbiX/SirB N-terminal domain-containing protein [Planctomycetota bacterium]
MQALIILGHGSRVPEAGRDMERVAAGLKEKYRQAMVEVCYMSQLGPHFPEVFDKCVAAGATEVLVLPYFLHMGQHLRSDIPRILREKAKGFPHVRVVLGRHLGFDPLLTDLLEKRVVESAGLPDVRALPAPAADEDCAEEHEHGASHGG